MDIARFESLGDNCEFGFVMARHQPKKSSLLRWALTPFPVLTRLLRDDFKDLYQFENLEPTSPKMLLDRGTGVRFHTDMVRDSVFVEDHKAVYEKEIHKVAHLRQRLEEQLQNPDMIFVYKGRQELPKAELQTLADLVSRRGGAQLLYVTAKGDLPPGSVEAHGDNLHIARIDRFADYATANVTSEAVWDQILENASIKIAPRARSASDMPGSKPAGQETS
ncbi:hypothetical protein [Pararhodobacter zhoushanensis]|uniref:Papain-like cysteine peptidase n=1 Tax=Pararhodobacter zhoushanensis TaxID=2479545 RepID=A0ABT3H2B4_9RHOB|nr:hypothetical protein [Pararhodobacter zhoushanensis]MCW1933922.1 hypothetical protein [Pararhodobacter zhoushanensis]